MSGAVPGRFWGTRTNGEKPREWPRLEGEQGSIQNHGVNKPPHLAILLDIRRPPWKQDIRKQLITKIYEGSVVWKYRNNKCHQINETGPSHIGSPDLEESLATFFTFLLPTTSDSKDFEYPRLTITKESRRENSESQNLLCYKNQTKKCPFTGPATMSSPFRPQEWQQVSANRLPIINVPKHKHRIFPMDGTEYTCT